MTVFQKKLDLLADKIALDDPKRDARNLRAELLRAIKALRIAVDRLEFEEMHGTVKEVERILGE